MCRVWMDATEGHESEGVKRMDKKVCDRCGDTIKYPMMPNHFKLYAYYTKICFTRVHNDMYKSVEIDLCDKCRSDFEKWIENTKPTD